MKEQQQISGGATVALTAVVATLFIIVSFMPVRSCVQKQEVQIAKYQAAADKWDRDCKAGGGQIISNYKGNPTYLCFGQDGRLIASR